jgi:transcriptional regulator with XRE-family HTH domain
MSVKRQTRRQTFVSDLKAVGRRIRQLRGFDLTQADFARKLGISQSQLSKYERGVAAPPADVLIRLKELLQISVDWLLTGDDEGSASGEGLDEVHRTGG